MANNILGTSPDTSVDTPTAIDTSTRRFMAKGMKGGKGSGKGFMGSGGPAKGFVTTPMNNMGTKKGFKGK